MFNRVAMTTQNHGCGTAQPWFKKIFFGYGCDGWAEAIRLEGVLKKCWVMSIKYDFNQAAFKPKCCIVL